MRYYGVSYWSPTIMSFYPCPLKGSLQWRMNVVFPSVYKKFINGLDILNFDVSWVVSIECIIDTDIETLRSYGYSQKHLHCCYASKSRFRESSWDRSSQARIYAASADLSGLPTIFFNTVEGQYQHCVRYFQTRCLDIYVAFMCVLYVLGILAFYEISQNQDWIGCHAFMYNYRKQREGSL